ncbi:HK97 gp10 family phage protein [Pseudomonas sp. ArH3a]|uniref:HK97 gp10 family phage protein n=1 Tax=Pseudomonas sp. ArH3a TaxID=2862945 RepID=UPI001F58981B|nr:HK97 gp10 family phage protein [Pseudomonas sp. ArH3a]UNM17273.1 HK97 gp10 family phage protein [Pseudomonas sp. ArH3a]
MARGWSVPPSLFAGVVEQDLSKKVRTIAIQCLNEVVMRSPVDTGRFRANNQLSIGSPIYTSREEFDKNGGATILEGVAKLSGLEPYTVVFIQNSLPYAEKLENGHSKQAPAGMFGAAFNSVARANQ